MTETKEQYTAHPPHLAALIAEGERIRREREAQEAAETARREAEEREEIRQSWEPILDEAERVGILPTELRGSVVPYSFYERKRGGAYVEFAIPSLPGIAAAVKSPDWRFMAPTSYCIEHGGLVTDNEYQSDHPTLAEALAAPPPVELTDNTAEAELTDDNTPTGEDMDDILADILGDDFDPKKE